MALNFVDYLRSHNVDTHRLRWRPTVPRIVPQLRVLSPEDPRFEAWCHHQLHPCRSDAELRPAPTVSRAEALRLSVEKSGVMPESVLRVLRGCQLQSEETEEEVSEDGDNIDADDAHEDWNMAGRADQLPAEEDADPADQTDMHHY